MYPYFQARFKNDGEAIAIVEVLVSDDEFDDLVQQGFGITSEEYFANEYNNRKAKELYNFLKRKKIDMLTKSVR